MRFRYHCSTAISLPSAISHPLEAENNSVFLMSAVAGLSLSCSAVALALRRRTGNKGTSRYFFPPEHQPKDKKSQQAGLDGLFVLLSNFPSFSNRYETGNNGQEGKNNFE